MTKYCLVGVVPRIAQIYENVTESLGEPSEEQS